MVHLEIQAFLLFPKPDEFVPYVGICPFCKQDWDLTSRVKEVFAHFIVRKYILVLCPNCFNKSVLESDSRFGYAGNEVNLLGIAPLQPPTVSEIPT